VAWLSVDWSRVTMVHSFVSGAILLAGRSQRLSLAIFIMRKSQTEFVHKGWAKGWLNCSSRQPRHLCRYLMRMHVQLASFLCLKNPVMKMGTMIHYR
jgi:hypothetical protein